MFTDDILGDIVVTILIVLFVCIIGVLIASAMCPREIADSNCIVYNEKLYCERND